MLRAHLGMLEQSDSKTYGFTKEIQAFLTKPLILLRFYKVFVKTGSNLRKFRHSKTLVFLRKYNKNENLCYHGTGSEESAREGACGQNDGRSCFEQLSKARKTTETETVGNGSIHENLKALPLLL